MGHVLRREDCSLLKQVPAASRSRWSKAAARGRAGAVRNRSVLSEAPEHRSLQELEELAQERGQWRQMVHRVKSRGAAVLEAEEKSTSCELVSTKVVHKINCRVWELSLDGSC